MRRSEYGGVPWYLMFTIVAAGAVGSGTYVVLHDREVAKAKAAALEAAKPKPPKPAPAPAPSDRVRATSITIDTPQVEGELTATDVELRVGGVRERVDICYAGVDGSGTLELEFTVHSSGSPTLIMSKKTFDESLANCVIAVFETLRFPSRTSNTQVTQSIRFQKS